jgi:hypothetical protein
MGSAVAIHQCFNLPGSAFLLTAALKQSVLTCEPPATVSLTVR